MALIPSSEVRDVHGISLQQKMRICDYLQGAVYCWCKNRKDEWFSMRDLMGGENFQWQGTPLYALYKKQVTAGVLGQEATTGAGKDSGWLLKRVISEDLRQFETKKEELIRKYRWVPAE